MNSCVGLRRSGYVSDYVSWIGSEKMGEPVWSPGKLSVRCAAASCESRRPARYKCKYVCWCLSVFCTRAQASVCVCDRACVSPEFCTLIDAGGAYADQTAASHNSEAGMYDARANVFEMGGASCKRWGGDSCSDFRQHSQHFQVLKDASQNCMSWRRRCDRR